MLNPKRLRALNKPINLHPAAPVPTRHAVRTKLPSNLQLSHIAAARDEWIYCQCYAADAYGPPTHLFIIQYWELRLLQGIVNVHSVSRVRQHQTKLIPGNWNAQGEVKMIYMMDGNQFCKNKE